MRLLLTVVNVIYLARADVILPLPQNASPMELKFLPALDYDKDGCYNTAAISPDGTLNPGRKLGGDVNGHCRDPEQIENANLYSRAKCNNGWCAIMYAGYFEKDQATLGPLAIGHRHDWEHIIAWVQNDVVQYVSTTQHSGCKWYARDKVLFHQTNHPKCVYHKDGASTHFYRLANNNDEPPENYQHQWLYLPLVGYDGYPTLSLKDKLMTGDFGSGTIKINEERFANTLASCKPKDISFDPYGPNSLL